MTRENPRRLFLLLASGAIVVSGAFLLDRTSAGVGGSDSAGYANTARDMLAGRIVVPVEAPGRLGLDSSFAPLFVPLAHEPGPRPLTMVPFYPPGFPAHVALATLVAGEEAGPHVVNPIVALLTVCLTYVLGRQLGLSRPYAFAGAAMLGASTAFLFCAVRVLSDDAAALWAVAAVVAALRSRRNDFWAAVAGAAFGITVLVRPTNALLILPLALALPWRLRAFALFGAGGLPFAGLFAAWNRAAFGSPFKTGYTYLFGVELKLSNFPPRFARYGGWLVEQFTPLVPLGWLATAVNRRVPGRDRAMLLLWFIPIFFFYCFWGPADNWTYLRYLLPVAPALIVGFLLCLRDLAARVTRPAYRAAVAVGVLAIVFVCERRYERPRRPIGDGRHDVLYRDALRELAARAEGQEAIVLSMDFSAATRYYTEMTPLRWDRVTPETFAVVRRHAAAHGERIYAVLLPHEVENAAGRAPGPWVFLGNVAGAGIWELPPAS
jgi:hypothetical protein